MKGPAAMRAVIKPEFSLLTLADKIVAMLRLIDIYVGQTLKPKIAKGNGE